LEKKIKEFLDGHPIAKSPYSAYRLTPSFTEILKSPEGKWQELLKVWIQKDEIRKRLEFQAQMAEATRLRIDTKHADLINSSIRDYAPKFLPGFEVIYVDDGDGDRITEDDKEKLSEAGITILLGDAMPDVLLWSREKNALWVIEAVTSDGEVDNHKVAQMTNLAQRSGMKDIGFTTAYRTWKEAAKRQDCDKNLAVRTFVWIMSDPSKHFLTLTFLA